MTYLNNVFCTLQFLLYLFIWTHHQLRDRTGTGTNTAPCCRLLFFIILFCWKKVLLLKLYYYENALYAVLWYFRFLLIIIKHLFSLSSSSISTVPVPGRRRIKNNKSAGVINLLINPNSNFHNLKKKTEIWRRN